MVHFCMASFFRGRGGEYICIQRGGYDAHAQTHKIDLKSIWFASNMYPEPFLKTILILMFFPPNPEYFFSKWQKAFSFSWFWKQVLNTLLTLEKVPFYMFVFFLCVCFFFCLFVCLFLFCFLYESHISTFEFKWPTQVILRPFVKLNLCEI